MPSHYQIAISAAADAELDFVTDLQRQLQYYLGGKDACHVWTPRLISETNEQAATIEAIFPQIDAFVIVWSPVYQQQCQAELAVILHHAAVESGRLFVLELLPEPRPASLSGVMGYQLWENNLKGYPQPLLEFHDQPKYKTQYRERLIELATELASQLKTLPERACAPAWADYHAASVATVSTTTQVFLAPPRNHYFTGRTEILQALAEDLPQQPLAVYGLGGVGKTQTVAEYAYQRREQYSAVLWVGAESAESLDSGWLRIAEKIGLYLAELDRATVQTRVWGWLKEHSGWLLVLDNVEDLDLISGFVGELKAYGQVVLTTRATNTAPVAESLELREMDAAEGLDFLLRRTGLEADESAEQLVEVLGGLPLALEQAAAYIAGGKSFVRYLELYQTHGVQLLAKRGLLAHPDDHPDPVAVTWLLSFEALQATPLAAEILQQCAFLYGDGIVQEVFDGLDPLEYDEAIDEILRYSLLRRDDDVGLLFMHRLVQVMVRVQLEEVEQQVVVMRVVELLVDACPNDDSNFRVWSNRRAEWLLNAYIIEKWTELLEFKCEAVGILFNQMGYYLDIMGNYTQALPLYQKSSEILEQMLSQQHPNYAASLNNIAALHQTRGDYVQALHLLKHSLEITKQAVGKQHPDYARSLNNLAGLYQAQGDYAQAFFLYQQALEITAQTLGEQNLNYALNLNNLAVLHDCQGNYMQALHLFQQSLGIIEQLLGKQHPNYAQIINNIGEIYQSQGKYSQALQLYQQALETKKQVLGKQHPDYATSLNNLAGFYEVQGKYEQAISLYQEALEIKAQSLGKQHPDYAQTLNNLATLYYSQGYYSQVLPLYQEALEIYGQALGKQHPDYASILNNLAEMYRVQGEYTQALPLYQKSLKIKEEILGKKHPDCAQSLNNIAVLYHSQGKYEEALGLYKQALKIRELALGKQHPDFAQSLNNLAELYREQGNYANALPLYQQVLEITEQILGKQHPNYAQIINNLALLYDNQGEYTQALSLYKQALEIRQKTLGQQHPDYAQSLNNLAGLYNDQGKYMLALPLYQQALEIREQVLGKQHPDYALSLNNLAGLYDDTGDYTQALNLYQKALTILTQTLGLQHPKTKAAQKNYLLCQQAIKQKTPSTRKTQKVGRNQPCPCGSGKKYKQCCGKAN